MEVGSEVECTCPRCKSPTGHVIVYFQEDGCIGRVECRVCGLQHPYTSHKKRVIRRPPPDPRSVKARLQAPQFEECMRRLGGREARTYRMYETYLENEVIIHETFGMGLVIWATDDRIEVIFGDGPKILVHGYRKMD